MTARSPQRQQLEDLLRPVVSAEGFDLEDLSVTAAGRRSLIRVTVDGEDGIDLDDIATVSRVISDALDGAEADGTTAAGKAVFAGPYVLEVSSPGVDRPLTEPRHWRRASGRLVTVAISDPDQPGATPVELTGRVSTVEDGQLGLQVEGDIQLYPWTRVGTGRVQIEFSRPGEPEPAEEEA